ncbi:MAG: hypothetical protein KIT58_00100 [Planctomycetota bacterium]|nr:hypothetical protein [Planctomycetota bacterium]
MAKRPRRIVRQQAGGVPPVVWIVGACVVGAAALLAISGQGPAASSGPAAITDELVEATAREILDQQLRAQGGLPPGASEDYKRRSMENARRLARVQLAFVQGLAALSRLAARDSRPGASQAYARAADDVLTIDAARWLSVPDLEPRMVQPQSYRDALKRRAEGYLVGR